MLVLRSRAFILVLRCRQAVALPSKTAAREFEAKCGPVEAKYAAAELAGFGENRPINAGFHIPPTGPGLRHTMPSPSSSFILAYCGK